MKFSVVEVGVETLEKIIGLWGLRCFYFYTLSLSFYISILIIKLASDENFIQIIVTE